MQDNTTSGCGDLEDVGTGEAAKRIGSASTTTVANDPDTHHPNTASGSGSTPGPVLFSRSPRDRADSGVAPTLSSLRGVRPSLTLYRPASSAAGTGSAAVGAS